MFMIIQRLILFNLQSLNLVKTHHAVFIAQGCTLKGAFFGTRKFLSKLENINFLRFVGRSKFGKISPNEGRKINKIFLFAFFWFKRTMEEKRKNKISLQWLLLVLRQSLFSQNRDVWRKLADTLSKNLLILFRNLQKCYIVMRDWFFHFGVFATLRGYERRQVCPRQKLKI